jgi:anti-sigma factor RsiW
VFWGRKHPVSEAELSALADASVSRGEQTRIEAHVASCASCRETLAELRVVQRTLRALPRATAPRSFALRQSDVAPARKSGTSAMGAAMPALSGVTLAAFLAFGVLVGMDMNDPEGASDRSASSPNPALSSGGAEADALAPSEVAADAYVPGAQNVDSSVLFRNAYSLTATAGAIGLGTPFSTPTPASVALSDDGGSMALRVGEIAAASVGLVAGGSLAAAWWRRRT